ncbi:hypothetical protein KDL29_08810 [bacterium]|nr:hypothetical protein [bacterium]
MELPAPSDIERGSSAVQDYERAKPGYDYYFGLPVANYSGSKFYPNWEKPADGLALAAFAGYRFGFSDTYDDEARLRLLWNTPPVDFGNVFVALANFSSNHWDWYPCPEDGNLIDDISDYTSPTNGVYAVVLLLGKDQADLNTVLLGSNVGPYCQIYTDLDLDPSQNTGPRIVTISASQAYSIGGEIVAWDFDFEGDGTYDTLGDTDGLEVHKYDPGLYNLQVRVTDDSGKQGIFSSSFTIVNPFNQAPVAGIAASQLTGSAPLTLDVNASFSSDADGTITKYEYDYDNDGDWDIVTDNPDPVEVLLSAFGVNTVTLRVTDNDFATDTDTVDITLDSGWLYSYVDQDLRCITDIAMGVVGSDAGARACVVYEEREGSKLRYSSGANSAHNSWTGIKAPIGNASLGDAPSLSVTYNNVDDYPMIAYTAWDGSLNDKLRVVRGNDTYGNSWKAPVQLGAEQDFSICTDIAMVNGLPVVAGITNFDIKGESEILYFQSTSSSGASWTSGRVVLPKLADTSYRSVAITTWENGLFDRPLLAFTQEFSPPYTISNGLVRSTNADGTAWESPTFLHEGGTYDVEAGQVNGNPVVLAGSTSQGGHTYYARSGDETGTQWPAEMQQVCEGGDMDLGIWGGRPCIAARNLSGILTITRGTDANGTAWEEPIPVERRDLKSSICAMAVVNDMPVICYIDFENDRMLAAAWKSN